MYKVLIADDEMIIRTDLAKAFDWAAFGMEIVGLAKNGLEAFNLASSLKPDLCLLDINMPFLNGLELIEKLNGINPNGINVIITGYDEFQYARKAVQLGVYDYVLKPIEEDAFINMLHDIKNKLDSLETSKNQELLCSAMLSENNESLRNEFLIRWVHGEKTQQEIRQGLAYFHMTIPENTGLVLLKVAMPIGLVENEAAKTKQIDQCKKVLSEALEKDSTYCFVELQVDCFLLFVQASDSVLWNNIERMLEQQLLTSMDLQVKATKKLVRNGADGIPDAFTALKQQIKCESNYLPLVKKIKKYVEKNYEDSQLRLQTFAEENQISISYLSKIFKQETGSAFIDYLIKFRIMKSLELLERSSLKICTISEMVGYSSQHYYCEAFKKVMGMAPTEYRRRGDSQN